MFNYNAENPNFSLSKFCSIVWSLFIDVYDDTVYRWK